MDHTRPLNSGRAIQICFWLQHSTSDVSLAVNTTSIDVMGLTIETFGKALNYGPTCDIHVSTTLSEQVPSTTHG